MIAQSESGGARPRARFSLPRLSEAAALVMKYGWRSRAVINVAKSPSRRRNTLALALDDVLSGYIGIILPSCDTCNDSSC